MIFSSFDELQLHLGKRHLRLLGLLGRRWRRRRHLGGEECPTAGGASEAVAHVLAVELVEEAAAGAGRPEGGRRVRRLRLLLERGVGVVHPAERFLGRGRDDRGRGGAGVEAEGSAEGLVVAADGGEVAVGGGAGVVGEEEGSARGVGVGEEDGGGGDEEGRGGGVRIETKGAPGVPLRGAGAAAGGVGFPRCFGLRR